MKKSNGTPSYARLHANGQLTLPQQSAVDLLAAGKNDTQTAEALNLNRVTVTKWRLYDPSFQAALNERRAEIWGAAADRLRALLPKALDVLAEVLNDPKRAQVSVALQLLRMARMMPPMPGPTEPEEIVRTIVDELRERAPDPMDDMFNRKNLPDYGDHVNEVWSELKNRASSPTPDAQ